MSENKHTPEPWSVDPDSTDYYASILDANGADTILLGDYVDWWMTKANARRIVACVNACAGIPTYQLTAENDNPTNLGEVIDAIRNQRDELLADVAEESAVRERLATLLAETAIAIKGPEAALFRHSWHDLAEVAAGVVRQRDELLAAFERFMDSHEECTDFDGFTAQIVSMADYNQAQEDIARVKGEQ